MRPDVKIGLATLALVVGGLGYWYYNLFSTSRQDHLPLVADASQVGAGAQPGDGHLLKSNDPSEYEPMVAAASPTPAAVAVAVNDQPPVMHTIEFPTAGATPTPVAALPPITHTRAAPLRQQDLAVYYTHPGDTLASVAKAQNVTVQQLKAVNPSLSDTRSLRADTKVYLPEGPSDWTGTTAAAPVPAGGTRTDTAPAAVLGSGQKYTVVSGDSLWKVSKKFYSKPSKSNIQKIIDANAGVLKGKTELKVGMELVIPAN